MCFGRQKRELDSVLWTPERRTRQRAVIQSCRRCHSFHLGSTQLGCFKQVASREADLRRPPLNYTNSSSVCKIILILRLVVDADNDLRQLFKRKKFTVYSQLIFLSGSSSMDSCSLVLLSRDPSQASTAWHAWKR